MCFTVIASKMCVNTAQGYIRGVVTDETPQRPTTITLGIDTVDTSVGNVLVL